MCLFCLLSVSYTHLDVYKRQGQSREDRIAIIRQAMAEKKADWFVLTSLDDIAWLLNFRGNDVQDNPVVLAYLMMSADSLRLYTNADRCV